MIGAVVGVQPFGGEGLSGTGPKAGGPWMIPALQNRTGAAQALPATAAGMAPGGALGRLHDAVTDANDLFSPADRLAFRAAIEAAAGKSEACGPRTLDGPTGESNTWQLHARGEVLCLGGETPTDIVHQAIACVATGNTVTLDRKAPGAAALSQLLARAGVAASECASVAEAVATGRFAGLLCLPGLAREALAWAAAAPGAVLPVILPDVDGTYPLRRLLAERSVSTNTAAAGGNASLLAIAA
jgi:RHH-type proline utilization regulon transcriptional repressor/proline dehydrogenase/delta 1-pyrroline-5-carboxylate dehydrogenase